MIKIDNFPDELRAEAKDEAFRSDTTITAIVVEGTRREIARLRKIREETDQ